MNLVGLKWFYVRFIHKTKSSASHSQASIKQNKNTGKNNYLFRSNSANTFPPRYIHIKEAKVSNTVVWKRECTCRTSYNIKEHHILN